MEVYTDFQNRKLLNCEMTNLALVAKLNSMYIFILEGMPKSERM